MGQMIDLRKYNIKTDEDAIEFLELFIKKAPQIVQHLKNAKLKQTSLRNRLQHAENKAAQAPAVDAPAGTDSVLSRLTGANQAARKSPTQDRLSQLRAAQIGTPASAPQAPAEPSSQQVEDDLPPAPVAPGQIGQLNVADVAPQAPAESQPAPSVASEGVVPQGVDSKSEDNFPNEDAVQSEDSSEEELSDEDRKLLQAPTVADITPVGDNVAAKTKGQIGAQHNNSEQ